MGKLSGIYSSALWAMERQFKKVDGNVSEQIRALRRNSNRNPDSCRGGFQRLLGPVLLWTTRREEKRLAQGQTYEPPTILARSNWAEAYQALSNRLPVSGRLRQFLECWRRGFASLS